MKFSVCLATGYEGLVYPIAFCEPEQLIVRPAESGKRFLGSTFAFIVVEEVEIRLMIEFGT